jgi:hypothetical protein
MVEEEVVGKGDDKNEAEHRPVPGAQASHEVTDHLFWPISIDT